MATDLIARAMAASSGNQLADKAYVDGRLNTKVDKADGMGLSSNDYTTAEKQKLAALTNYDDSAVNSAIADLQAGKADKSDTYTKSETDTKITEKVAEIVADAPEDFNTLKEMSDWIANHETSAAAMNSAIQTNASNISSLQAGKVDKATGKSLVSDSEIARLATLENYDDTAVKSDIADIQSVIPATASAENQLAVKSDIADTQSGSPYTYMTQEEYESLTEYEPDRLYWVTYPLSNQHLVWKNGECYTNEGVVVRSNTNAYVAIAYDPQTNGSSSGYFTSNLKKIDLAKGITSIYSYAFSGCTSLTDISIPDGVTSIYSYAFSGCTKLINVLTSESIAFVDEKAFDGVPLESQDGIKYADKWAISYDNSNIENANIKSGTKGIACGAFKNCNSLKSVSLPEGLTYINKYAFYNCQHLTNEIIIPEGVKTIDEYTFYSVNYGLNITIPSTVTTIASNAFTNSSMSIPAKITINKPADSISGSPWGAVQSTIIWTG